MKKRKSLPLRLPGDSVHHIAFVSWAQKQTLPIERPSPYQYKIGPWNYYPTRQTFNSDHEPSAKLNGFALFKEKVLKWRDFQVDLDDHD